MATQFKRDAKAIELLGAATLALADYRDHVRGAHGSDAYQIHATSEILRELRELLREERRGWTDL
jgi:LmbE family N-acetylglucosaminyl deacetylase